MKHIREIERRLRNVLLPGWTYNIDHKNNTYYVLHLFYGNYMYSVTVSHSPSSDDECINHVMQDVRKVIRRQGHHAYVK